MQRLLWIFLSLLALSTEAKAREYTQGLYAGNHFASGPRLPVCGDFNGDGLTDLGCVYTQGKSIIDLSLMSKALKFHRHRAVVSAVGGETLAAIAGQFNDSKASEIAVLLNDGRLVLAHSLNGTKMSLSLVGTFKNAVKKKYWAGLALRKISREGESDDLVLVRKNEKWLRFRFAKGAAGVQLTGHKAHTLTLDPTPTRPAELKALRKSVRLKAGDFNGDGTSDLLGLNTGTHSFSRNDLTLFFGIPKGAKDSDGDGLSDEKERKIGSDPYDLDSDGDGLLDGWEIHGHGGLDLAAMGCTATGKDVVVYLQRWSDVDGATIAREWTKIVAYYANLPIKNRRGPKGIRIHGVFLQPLKVGVEKRSHWRELGQANLPLPARGLAHYMVIGPGGGGQSSLWGTMGGCGVRAFYAVFIHEFGHQLGLSHTGGDKANWCPIYPSLMNYAYSYSLSGNRRNISYSHGKLAGHILREDQLKETLPFAMKDVSFLSKGPYHYRLKQSGKKSTLIDWNRNGQFDKGLIKADINSGYSTTAGKRHTLGKTVFAPVLVSTKKQAHLFWISETQDQLKSRTYLGSQKWDKAQLIGLYKLRRDPSGIAYKSQLYLALPLVNGVQILTGPSPGSLRPGYTIPESSGCEVTLLVYQSQLYALLWNERDKSIFLVELSSKGAGPPNLLPVKSDIPPGACEDTLEDDLVLGIAGRCGNRPFRWKIARLFKEERAGWMVKEQEWLEGKSGRAAGTKRPLLFFETGSNAGVHGRIHFLAPGIITKKNKRGCFYDAMSVGDPNYRSGWMVKRYYDEWTRTQSPIGATWFKGDILLAYRWHGGGKAKNNRLQLAHQGLGIQSVPMSDHNDLEHITKWGLNHSLRWLRPWDAVK
jgi:hypothetical protein